MKRTIGIALTIAILGLGGFFLVRHKVSPVVITAPIAQPPTVVTTPPEPVKPVVTPVVPEGPINDQMYYTHTMKTSNVQKELSGLVGSDNVLAVLKVNRIDSVNIKLGTTIVIPTIFDMDALSPFPLQFENASSISKLLIISQKIQAFGVYEHGVLVRWGPVSSGKKSTPTASKLYSTNWKGKEVHSSFSDEWILKYNFNIDNANGIGFHQYEMPGYPASHSCVRLLMDDAMWLYDWADQWIVTPSGNTELAHGTPVIVFGEYAFGKTAPWKLLPENPDAANVTTDELGEQLSRYMDTINQWQVERDTVLAVKQ